MVALLTHYFDTTISDEIIRIEAGGGSFGMRVETVGVFHTLVFFLRVKFWRPRPLKIEVLTCDTPCPRGPLIFFWFNPTLPHPTPRMRNVGIPRALSSADPSKNAIVVHTTKEDLDNETDVSGGERREGKRRKSVQFVDKSG